MEIVFLGQQNWDVCWTAKQQFATRLAERGHRVLFVDPLPAEPEQAARLRADVHFGIPGLRHVGPRELYVYTYVKIPPLRWRINRARFFHMAPRVLDALGMRAPVALCLHPVLLPWLKRAGARAWVYYAVDEYTAYHGMPDAMKREVRAAEEEILRGAEVALAVSPTLRDRFATINPDSVLLENGADREHYHPDRLARIAPHPAVADLRAPVIGLIGQVDNRIDRDLVLTLARRRRDWTFVFAGRPFAIDTGALEAEPNIRLLGYQPYEVLPNVAARVDAWILPYVQSELTHACNPMKLYEYLATGKPVVATPLDGIRAVREHVALALGVDAVETALAAALADPAHGRAERLAAAAANDWYERTDRLEAVFERAVEKARRAGRPEARRLTPVGRLPCGIARPYVSEHGQHFAAAFGPKQRLAQPVSRVAGLIATAVRRTQRRLAGTPAGIRSILVVRRGYLGDFVVLLPALAYLRRRFPDARIVLGVQHDMTSADLFRDGTYVDEVMPVDVLRRGGGVRAQLRGLAGLFGRGFDLVIGGGLYTMLAEGLHTGAPRYVGLDDGHPDQRIQGRVLRRDDFRHESENNLALVEAVGGVVAEDADRLAPLRLPEAEVASATADLLPRLAIPAGGRVLVVHPGAKRATRRWPAERLGAVVAAALERFPDLTVVLTGGGGERRLTADVLAAIPSRLRTRVRDAAGATGLLDLVGLLDRATALLSNDTGVMHLARARSTPLVALMGPENDKVWGPAPLGTAPALSLRRIVPCAPCLRETCAAHYCLRALAVEDVTAAVAELLETGRMAHGESGMLERRNRRLSWAELAAAGFDVPLVTIVVDATQRPVGPALASALEAAERQTYPRLEVLILVRDTAGWTDDREPSRRAALPVRQVAIGADADVAEAGRLHAAGELIAWADPDDPWPAAHVAVDVAAALRAPEEAEFRWGRPVRQGHGGRGTMRREPPRPPAAAKGRTVEIAPPKAAGEPVRERR